jgi:hypothetical protein
MDSEDRISEAEECVELATSILKELDRKGIDENIAQAALGNAWYRLCKSMPFRPETFKEMCDGMVEVYKESFNDEE